MSTVSSAPGLILFSHGSVLCGAGQMLHEHAAALRARGEFSAVEVGFLNYSKPTFLDAVRACAEHELERAVVAPYFLVPGKFVRDDIPRVVAEAKEEIPEVSLTVAKPIGYDDRLADAIAELAACASGPERWRGDLCQAPAFCMANPRCLLYGTTSCPASFVTTAPEKLRIAEPSTSKIEGQILELETVVLVVAHGSPTPSANDEMYAVVERLRRIGEAVEVGFLDCNEPDIPAALDRCAAKRAGRVVTVPYFLHTGRHVADDIPSLLEEAVGRHPGVEFLMSRYLGSSHVIAEILADRALEAMR